MHARKLICYVLGVQYSPYKTIELLKFTQHTQHLCRGDRRRRRQRRRWMNERERAHARDSKQKTPVFCHLHPQTKDIYKMAWGCTVVVIYMSFYSLWLYLINAKWQKFMKTQSLGNCMHFLFIFQLLFSFEWIQVVNYMWVIWP